MRRFSTSLLLFCAVAATSTVAAAQEAAQVDPNAISLQGRIVSFNLNNRGLPEGMIVQSQGQLGQVNFPNDFTDGQTLAVGDLIEITIAPDRGGPGRGAPPPPPPAPDGRGPGPQAADGRGPPAPPQPDHAVYRLLALRDARGKQYAVSAPPERSFGHVQGVVQAVNYDRRGVANGAQLGSGDFVRLEGPEAQQVQLTIGMNLTADGPAETMPNGRLSLQAQQINGITIRGPGPGRGPDPNGPPPPPPPPSPPPPGGDAPPLPADNAPPPPDGQQ